MKKLVTFALLLLAAISVAACGGRPVEEPNELRVMTHDSFAVSEGIIEQFEEANGVSVVIVQSGDAGTMVNQAILNKEAPVADVLYGIDNTLLTRGLDEDIFVEFTGDASAAADYQLDDAGRVVAIDYGDVCLNVDLGYLADNGLAMPTSLDDLIKPEYANLLVVQNPASSSPGLAFLLATIGHYGPDGYLDFWAALKDNGVKIAEDWESAYWGDFTVGGGGNYPLVVSYASSPPAEVLFADPPVSEAPTAAVVAPDTCFRQVEFAGVLANAAAPNLGTKFIEFMLSPTFQEDIPMQMFVFPVNVNATLPDAFVEYASIPEQPAFVSPADIAANRENWIEEWTDLMLR